MKQTRVVSRGAVTKSDAQDSINTGISCLTVLEAGIARQGVGRVGSSLGS
jgi:hypothetical protein